MEPNDPKKRFGHRCTCDQTPNSWGQGPSIRGHEVGCPVRVALTETIRILGLSKDDPSAFWDTESREE